MIKLNTAAGSDYELIVDKNDNMTRKSAGYLTIILMMAVFVISVGLLIAFPVLETELKREKEEELIFRGRQYVEAVRVYLVKHPGTFPKSLKELKEKKCLRRLYRDPMTKSGEWNVILAVTAAGASSSENIQAVLVVPESALAAVKQPQVLGVVSSSKDRSIKIWNGQESYDRWLFFYGYDPNKMPEIRYLTHD